MGLEIDDLERLDPSLKHFNNSVYRYPTYEKIYAEGVRGIYLSNYIPWNQKEQQEYMSRDYGYTGCENDSYLLYNTYEYPHCAFYNGIQDWIKFMKHGYNRTLDHLVRDLRWKRLTKCEAVALLKKYPYQKPVKNIRLFREFMNMKKNAIDYLLDSMKNKLYFDRDSYQSNIIEAITSQSMKEGSSEPDLHQKAHNLYVHIKKTSIYEKFPHTLLTGYP